MLTLAVTNKGFAREVGKLGQHFCQNARNVIREVDEDPSAGKVPDVARGDDIVYAVIVMSMIQQLFLKDSLSLALADS